MKDPESILLPLLAGHPDEVADIVLATCAAVRKAAPLVSELIFKTYVVGDVFTFTENSSGGFIHVVAYTNHVNLGFFRGAELDDPEGLLEGEGKLIRHIRIRSKGDLRRKGVRTLIQLAVEQGIAIAEMRDGVQPRVVVDGPKAKREKQKTGKKVKKKARKKR